MRKIYFLLIGFFLFNFASIPVAFAADSCSIAFDPAKNPFSTIEGVTIRVAGIPADDNPWGGKFRIVVKDQKNNQQIRDFCDTPADLSSERRVLGNFPVGSYTVEIKDGCLIPLAESTICSASFTTKSDAAVTSDRISVVIDPQSYNYGDTVQIILDNIPKADGAHALGIRSSGQDRTGPGNLGAMAIQIADGKCDIYDASDLFKSGGTPVCDDGGGGFRVTAHISTEALGIPADDTTSHTYYVNLNTARGVGSQFTVAPRSVAINSFQIQSIQPNPAKPGDTITITITNAKPGEKYTYGIRGPASAMQTKICQEETCELSLTLSSSITSNIVDVLVQDTKGVQQTQQLSITLTTPIVSQVEATATPIPTVPLPCEAGKIDSQGRCTEVRTAIGAVTTDPKGLVTFIFGLLLSLSGGIALLLIIFAGYQIMTSAGNPEKIQSARDTITSAVIGLVFLIFSLVILEIINVQILRIPGFN